MMTTCRAHEHAYLFSAGFTALEVCGVAYYRIVVAVNELFQRINALT
jgi:hypothetical protein